MSLNKAKNNKTGERQLEKIGGLTMSEKKGEYGPNLIPYLTQMRFADDARKEISVKFGLYAKDRQNQEKTREWWSGKVSVEKLFSGLKKAGLITKEED